MNFYASSVALLWTTAMRLGNTRTVVREADAAERVAASPRPRDGSSRRAKTARAGSRRSLEPGSARNAGEGRMRRLSPGP
jgi:hypothetical protein